MSEARNQRITLRLTKDEHLRLRAFAVKHSTSPAELAHEAVVGTLERLGDPPSIYYEWRHRDGTGAVRTEE
jgi:hypothetical protein